MAYAAAGRRILTVGCHQSYMRRHILIPVLIFLAGCKGTPDKIKPFFSAISESVYASGSVKSKQQYEAFATVNGVIQDIYLTEGDTLNIGTPILSVANEVPQLNKENAVLAARYADAASNQDKLADARQNIDLQENKMKNDLLLLNRQKNLWEQNIGTRNELEQRTLAYESSRTAYFSAVSKYHDLERQIKFTASQSEKNLQVAQQQASDFTLKSKINGVVYKIYKKKGESVTLQTPLALIGRNDQFILEMQVDEYDIFKIRKNLLVLVTMDSYKDQVFKARVSAISPMMNESSKTFLVEATFENPPAQLYPFISFEANIVIDTKARALLVPRTALLNDSTLVKSNGDKVVVKTGLKDYKMVEVLSGVTANDDLIIPAK